MPISDLGAIYTPSIYGRTSFPLKHNGEPIFHKEFNASSERIVGIVSDKIYIKDHFFKTGEKLTYSAGSGTSIGIQTNGPGNVGFSSYLPNTVYPIVIDKDNIRVALASTLAYAGEYIGITTTGLGSVHTLTAEKQNSKCLISIDNIIQAPIAAASTVGILTYTSTSLTLENLKNIKIGTLIRLTSGSSKEIAKVSSINYTTKEINISRGDKILGTPTINFTGIVTNTPAEILSGQYNIVRDKIYFTEAPLEGKRINLTIPISSVDFADKSFNYFTGNDNIITGTQAVFYSENPPVELENGRAYFLIKSANNTFKFAATLFNAYNNIPLDFSTNSGNAFPVASFQLFLVLPNENSSFHGRVFLRSNYAGNYVFDDISEQFTGITSSFELKVSGVSTVGISSDNGIVLLNNVFQYPESEEAFEYRETGIGTNAKTYIDFVGYGASKSYDVNVKNLPRGGIIVSYGTTSGSLYAPQYPAKGIAVVSAAGTISNIIIGDEGSGYRTGITTYYIKIDNQEIPGSGALGIAYPNAVGIVTGVGIITGGSGYLYNGTSSTLTNSIATLDPNGTPIAVASTAAFITFRGNPVTVNNPGLVSIGNEILKYTGIGSTALTGTSRGKLGTIGTSHTAGVPVVKYEYDYIVKVDDPIRYDNIPLTGSVSGIGASISLKVNEFGEISDLLFTNFGYGYKVGEVLVPSGVLGISTQTTNDKLHITINEVSKDEFSAWNVGFIRKLEDLTNKVNGQRTIFTLFEKVDTGAGVVIKRTSFESNPASEIDLEQNLLIFVNDVLQIPGQSYRFLGGSQLEFTEPPTLGSSIKVYFYEGFTGDAQFTQPQTDVKEGDKLKIQRNIFSQFPLEQKTRTAQRVVSSDTVRTEVYSDRGLSNSSSQRRSVSWTRQKSDLIVNGEYIFKTRDSYQAGITSMSILSLTYDADPGVGVQTARITTTSGTFIGVNTNIIGLNTNAGIGSLVQIGDYVESLYVSVGTTVVAIGASFIDIGIPDVGISTGANVFIGPVAFSSSPSGTNVRPLTFYRKNP
jgi:hypothetical protein